jgi:hypothetical protein
MSSEEKLQHTQLLDEETDVVLATCLASGQSQGQAAKNANMTDRTVRRKMANPSFRALVMALRRAAVDRAASLLAQAMTSAVSRLELLVDSENEKVQLSASVAILEIGLKYHTNTDLSERLTALEATASNNLPTGTVVEVIEDGSIEDSEEQ